MKNKTVIEKLRAISWTKKILISFGIVFVVVLTVCLIFIPRNKPTAVPKGSVVTNGHECADIGRSILLKGGSAADAAIASLFCEGVAMPQSMGLGGGFLLTIYTSATGVAESLNARETAPKDATVNMFNGSADLSQNGGLAVAVPGELRGYWYLHLKYGKLPWKDLVQPTIDLCKKGILVTPFLSKMYRKQKELLYKDPVLRDIFINSTTNSTYNEGERVKRLRLVETLEIIAVEGGNALHNGSLTEKFVNDIQNNNGIITIEDMNNYAPEWQTPIQAELTDDQTIFTSPLPGSGAVLTFILNILKNFVDVTQPNSLITYQRIIEGFKFGYGKRTQLGDAHFLDVESLLVNLTSSDYAKDVRALIFDDRTFQDPLYYGANITLVEDHGTAHISILAPNGDAVAVTSTINNVFGAGFASNSTGIILNDEMDDFSSPNLASGADIPPSEANFIIPGKRPLSSMVPSIIVRNGRPLMVVGAAGGTKITTSVAQVIMKHLWFDRTIKESLDDKRIHHQLFPMAISFEEPFLTEDTDIVDGLLKIGHGYTITASDGFSAVTAVSNKSEAVEASWDKRRSGSICYLY